MAFPPRNSVTLNDFFQGKISGYPVYDKIHIDGQFNLDRIGVKIDVSSSLDQVAIRPGFKLGTKAENRLRRQTT